MPKLPEKYAGCHRHYYTRCPHWHGGADHDGVLPFDGNLGNHDALQATSLAEANFFTYKRKIFFVSTSRYYHWFLFLWNSTFQLYCIWLGSDYRVFQSFCKLLQEIQSIFHFLNNLIIILPSTSISSKYINKFTN